MKTTIATTTHRNGRVFVSGRGGGMARIFIRPPGPHPSQSPRRGWSSSNPADGFIRWPRAPASGSPDRGQTRGARTAPIARSPPAIRSLGAPAGPQINLPPPAAAVLLPALHEALVPVFHSHAQGKPGGCRDRLAQAAIARGPRAQVERRPLHLSAARPAFAAEDLAALPRGDGRGGGDRAVDAAPASGRILAGGAAVGRGPRDHVPRRPRGRGTPRTARAGVRARPDARGDHHAAGENGDHQLPRPPEELLPDCDEIPE